MPDPNLQKILVNKLLDERFDQVEGLFAKGLATLREALRAERTLRGRDGEPVCFVPDHIARLAAAKTFIELCVRNRRPNAKPPEPPRRKITMDELIELLKLSGEMLPDGRLRTDLTPNELLRYDRAEQMKRNNR